MIVSKIKKHNECTLTAHTLISDFRENKYLYKSRGLVKCVFIKAAELLKSLPMYKIFI